MSSHGPFFASTTSWLYKAMHLALIVSASDAAEVHLSVLRGLVIGMGVIVLVCVLPSLVHPVCDRRKTTALLVQTIILLSATQSALCYAESYELLMSAPLLVQLVSGHMFYSLSAACVHDKQILLAAPFVTIVFGTAALVLPVAASMSGPRAPAAHGLALVVALGVGEMCGVAVYCLAQVVHAGGACYEGVVRMLCE